MDEPAKTSALDNQGPGSATGGSAASSSGEPRVPLRLFALKHADTFIVADANGNVTGEGDGMFRDDTRVLSVWSLTVGAKRPALLSAALSQDNTLFISHLTNRPLPPLGGESLPQGVIHVERQRLIFEGTLYERITLSNFGPVETHVPVELEFDADLRDMFAVRGISRRPRADLALLTTDLKTGPFPYAGIPWFSTPFGRDAIITSLQMLWLDPTLARGVLAFLAANQAKERSAFQDSAPGKIMHETRKGEMAALHELPFGLYYGGVDTTPLFVMLAGAYAERTADLAFIEEIWPALERAMAWIEGDGDSNGDGFVDYMRAAASGLANQGR